MNIFSYLDYRTALEKLIDARKATDSAFTLTKLAQDMGIQPSYLTNVLKERAHLNSDQMYRAGAIFDLAPDEIDFLELLLEHTRTGIQERKKSLQAKIEKIRAKNLTTDKALAAPKVDVKDFQDASYYLDPFVSIIHQFLGTKERTFDRNQLAQRFGLSPEHAGQVLKTLQDIGLIKPLKNKNWEVLGVHRHLSKDSPLTLPHHVQLRQLSIDRLQRLGNEKFYSYSMVLTATEAEKTQIRGEFLSFIKKVEKWVTPAPSEHVYQINFDLFPW